MVTQWHEFFSFISCITDHEALITGTDVKFILFEMDGLGDIGALFINSDDNDSSPVVHADFDGVVADFLDGLSGNLFEVDFGLCADFAEDHADAVFDGTLAGHLGLGVLGETCVED
jgi:hypothetical protein